MIIAYIIHNISAMVRINEKRIEISFVDLDLIVFMLCGKYANIIKIPAVYPSIVVKSIAIHNYNNKVYFIYNLIFYILTINIFLIRFMSK